MKPAHDRRPMRVIGGRKTLLAAALLAGVLAALLAALPAYAELAGVAPRVDRTGFPAWYQDDTGARVNLCVDNRLCLGGDTRPNRSRPASPTVDANPRRPGLQPNMPDEAFYPIARAETELDQGGRIRWRGVLEGAFSSPVPRDGRQITFTRVQVTGSDINLAAYPAGTEFRFVTPYGEMTATVNGDGTLERGRVESPPGTKANGFTPPVTETVTGYGPTFLRCNPAVPPAAPAGFLGNPLVPHAIVGGDNGVNTFQVFEGLTPVSPLVSRFEIAGRCVQGTC
ncbi:MAG: hypothetical protein M3426_07910 [Actinomycetota bacterium]|nr:hypothetical protein [Actinomycetota bacterium]